MLASPLAALVVALHAGAAAPAPVRVLVLDLEPISVEASVVRSIDPIILGAAGELDGVEVVSQGEIKRLAEMEAAKAEIGCDTSSCLAELAGAMGARFVLFGTASRLGSTTTIALSLYDSSTAAISRDSVAVDDVGALPRELPTKVRALIARAAGLTRNESAPAAPTVEGPSLLYMAGVGGVALGAAGLVAGGVYAGINEATIQDRAASGATKSVAQENGFVGLVVAASGVVVAGLGALLMVLEAPAEGGR